MTKLVSIHHLRGLAALAVLVFHAVSFVAGYGSRSLPGDALQIGEAGVDIFFVISGFILTLVTRSPRSPAEFVTGRLIRVGLPYWVVTLALAAATLAVPGALRSFTWSGSDLLFSLAFVPSILRDGSIFPLLEPGWTLSLEILFYAVLAAGLGLKQGRRSVCVCLALIGLAIVGWLADLPQGQGMAWFYTQPILIEFCFGIAIAHAYLAGWRPSRAVGTALLLGGFAVFVVLAARPPEPFERVRLLAYGVPATMLVAGAVFLEAKAGWVRSRVLGFAGDISYSLYLTHVISLAIAAKLLAGRSTGLLGDAVMLIACSAVAIALATLFHLVIERPALRLAHRLQGSRAPASAPLHGTAT